MPRGQVEHQQAGDHIENHGRAVDPDAAKGIQQAAEGRRDDGRRLLGGLCSGNGAGEQRGGNDTWQQCLGGRHLERTRGAEQKREDEDHFPGDMAGGAANRQGQGNQGLQRLTDRRDFTPVIAVGDMPGVQHEQHARGKFHQTDQAQIQHVAGQLIEVPADGHGEHLKAAGGKYPSQPERDERAVMT